MKTVKKTFLSDWGHGWLSVKRKEIIELGIVDEITSYSYMKGDSVYLEEDCDMPLYMETQKARGVKVEIKSGKCHQTSPVRNYNSYNPKVVTVLN